MNELYVIRTFRAPPPKSLQDLMVSKTSEFYGVTNARFIDCQLVADHAPGFASQAGEKLRYIIEGLADGYRLCLGPNKPHGVTYWAKDRGRWRQKTEWFATFDEAVVVKDKAQRDFWDWMYKVEEDRDKDRAEPSISAPELKFEELRSYYF